MYCSTNFFCKNACFAPPGSSNVEYVKASPSYLNLFKDLDDVVDSGHLDGEVHEGTRHVEHVTVLEAPTLVVAIPRAVLRTVI